MENIPSRSFPNAGKGYLIFEGILARTIPVRLEGGQSGVDQLEGLLTSHAYQYISGEIRHVL